MHHQCWRPEFNPWVGRISWRRAWQPTPVFLLGEFNISSLEPGGLPSMGLQRVEPDWVTKHSTARSFYTGYYVRHWDMAPGLRDLTAEWSLLHAFTWQNEVLMAQQIRICLQCRRHRRWGFNPWIGKIPLSRKWQPTPIFSPGKLHGQRSRTGFSSCGHKEIGLSAHIHTERNSDLENYVLKKLVPLFFLKTFNVFNHKNKKKEPIILTQLQEYTGALWECHQDGKQHTETQAATWG